MRRLVLLLLGLSLLVGAAPSYAASAPRLQREMMVFTYDGLGPALLNVEGEVRANGRPGYFASVVADEFNGQLDPFFPDLIELGDDTAPVHTYGAPGSHDLCVSPVVSCTATSSADSLSFSSSFSVGKSTVPTHIRMIIAMEGTKVSATHLELGWKAHVRKDGFARFQSGGSGVRAEGTTVEAMPAATLRGGRAGSIAVAVPPCDDAGAGIVNLTGGTTAQSAVCPSGAFAAAARAATTWAMSGTAVGLTSYRTRLLVFDF